MKTLRFPLFVMLSALAVTPIARAAGPEETVAAKPVIAGEKLYVVIEAFDPIRFHELRHARHQAGELVLTTLKATAETSAKLAGFAGDVVVLDEDKQAPEGARVLRLTWTEGKKVTADLTENGKNYFLGVVSRQDLLLHPERMRLQRMLQTNPQPDAHSDASVRVATELNLYFALKQVATRDARAK